MLNNWLLRWRPGWALFCMFVNFRGVNAPTMVDPINAKARSWGDMHSKTPLLFPSYRPNKGK